MFMTNKCAKNVGYIFESVSPLGLHSISPLFAHFYVVPVIIHIILRTIQEHALHALHANIAMTGNINGKTISMHLNNVCYAFWSLHFNTFDDKIHTRIHPHTHTHIHKTSIRIRTAYIHIIDG